MGHNPANRYHEVNVPETAEVLRKATGELYRYRLAMHDQSPRVQAAVGAAEQERGRIRDEQHELLFAPSMPHEEFVARLEDIELQQVPTIWRLKSEVEFQMSAAYGVLTVARMIGRLAEGGVRDCVFASVAAFEAAAPDADVFRHVHVHPETHLLGEGRSATRLPEPTAESAIAIVEDTGPVYWVGGKLFNVSAFVEAAEMLAASVVGCGPAGD